MISFRTKVFTSVAVVFIVCVEVIGEPKESSKVTTLKRGDHDSKTESLGGSISYNSHSTSEAKTIVRTRENPKSTGHDTCNYSQPDVNCSDLDAECIDCAFNKKCRYGEVTVVQCWKKPTVVCKEDAQFTRPMICQYCYQTPLYQQVCNGAQGCPSTYAPLPRQYVKHNCTVLSNVLCMGNRRFPRMMPCNWKNGYRWSTTFVLSVTLGGFGADRFYLGRWQEGIGKLFSFGGLGLWTIIDIILIGVRYLGPADGSLYVD